MTKEFVRRLRRAFTIQRKDAIKRSVEFRLTFDEWLRVWFASGHLLERGCRKGQYVMARPNDIGPYVIDNVEIIPASQNVIDARAGKPLSAAHRRKLSAALIGRPRVFTASHRLNLSFAAMSRPLGCKIEARL
jgi:hypothetical protein